MGPAGLCRSAKARPRSLMVWMSFFLGALAEAAGGDRERAVPPSYREHGLRLQKLR